MKCTYIGPIKPITVTAYIYQNIKLTATNKVPKLIFAMELTSLGAY